MKIEMEVVNPEALFLDAGNDEQQKLAQMIAMRILAKYMPVTKSASKVEPPKSK